MYWTFQEPRMLTLAPRRAWRTCRLALLLSSRTVGNTKNVFHPKIFILTQDFRTERLTWLIRETLTCKAQESSHSGSVIKSKLYGSLGVASAFSVHLPHLKYTTSYTTRPLQQHTIIFLQSTISWPRHMMNGPYAHFRSYSTGLSEFDVPRRGIYNECLVPISKNHFLGMVSPKTTSFVLSNMFFTARQSHLFARDFLRHSR